MGTIRGILALVLFFPYLYLIASPFYGLTLLRNWLTGASASVKRKRATTWILFWGYWCWMWFKWVMRIRQETHLPPVWYGELLLMIFANHKKVFEALSVTAVCWQARRPVRFVAKESLFRWPVLGHALREAGNGSVCRHDTAKDLEAVRTCARLAKEDGASVLIFVEGTRRDVANPAPSAYKHLGDFKPGGVCVLHQEMPEYGAITLAQNWLGSKRGATMAEAGVVYEATYLIKGSFDERIEGDPIDWFRAKWQWVDSVLDQ